MFRPILASQLSRPSGVLGLLMGRVLNWINGNINQFTIGLMNVQPTDYVMDVGFGGGLMLQQLVKRTPQGFVAGIEISVPMLSQAQRKFRKLIAGKRLAINQADVATIPYDDAYFDKVCTVNTIYFWPDPVAGLTEIRRILKPGGELAIAIRPKEYLESIKFTDYTFTAYSPDEVVALLTRMGFSNIRSKARADRNMGAIVLIGEKG